MTIRSEQEKKLVEIDHELWQLLGAGNTDRVRALYRRGEQIRTRLNAR